MEDKVVEITQTQQEKEKELEKNENSLKDPWDNIKNINNHIISVPEQ